MPIQLSSVEKNLFNRKLQPGDIINISGHPSFFELHLMIAYAGIRGYQKEVFKSPDILVDKSTEKNYNPNMDTHTMIYFSNEMIEKYIGKEIRKKMKNFGTNLDTFSVEPPHATVISATDWMDGDITVLRYAKKELTEEDIAIMLHGMLPIIGTDYDIGQLLDIAINEIAGYPETQKYRIFESGSRQKVCSVGVAAVYTYWRHELSKKGIELPRLFSKLNGQKWTEEFHRQFELDGNKWSVEQTAPANFSNPGHFDNEFKMVLRMDKGRTIFSI